MPNEPCDDHSKWHYQCDDCRGTVVDTRDPDTGNFTERFTTEDVLAALCALGGQQQTTDIAAEVGCSRPTAYRRLDQLEQRGGVEKRKFGNVAVWEPTTTDHD